MSISGSKNSSSANSSQAYDPELTGLLKSNYARAEGIANTPFQSYTGDRVAGFGDQQNRYFDALGGIVTDQVGGMATDAAKNAAMGVASYNPTNVSAGSVTAGQLAGTDLSPYMNPYIDNVVNTSLADIERSRQMEAMQTAARAGAAGAFGGSRHGVADSLTNESFGRTAASTAGQLRYQGFNDAQGQAVNDINRRFTADTGNRDAALTASTANQTAGLQGAQLRLSGSQQLGAVSQQQLDQAAQRAGLLGTIATADQNQRQGLLDANYEEWLRQQNDPFARQTLLNQSAGLLPNSPLTTSSSTSKGSSFGFSLPQPPVPV